MEKKLTLLFLFTSMFLTASAQEFKMRRVTLNDVLNNHFLEDTTAKAVILFKWHKVDFEQDDIGNWEAVTKIRERIKIIKKEDINKAFRPIALKSDATKKELIDDVKIIIYYKEKSKLKFKKLNESNFIKHKISSKESRLFFDFSDVDIGSIIDISYTIHSPFYRINDLVIQENVPTRNFYASITIPSFFHYNRVLLGSPKLKINEKIKDRDLKSVGFKKHFENAVGGGFKKIVKDSVFQVTERTVEYETNNIKALKRERFSPNLENYRWLISYQLQSTDLPNESYKDYSSSWEEMIKQIYSNKLFSKILSEQSFLKAISRKIKNDSLSKKETVTKAFNYVKNEIAWNKVQSIYPQCSLHKTYTKKSGNVAEINLFLIALLKECGFKVYPVLTTTKSHSIRRQPTQDAFDYLLAYVELDYEDVLLDATEKNSMPNLLPERVLDVDGTIIYAKDDFRNIDLFPKELSHINSIMNIKISKEGIVSGNISSNISYMDAMTYRNAIDKISIEKHKNLIKLKNNFAQIERLNIKNLKNLEQPINESYAYELKDKIDLSLDNISFSPLFFLSKDENSFAQNERTYPINFGYKHQRKNIINIKIPEGFKIASLPQSVKINLPESVGYFQYQISKTSNNINLVTEFKMNKAMIPTHQYLQLKSFFEQMIKKESEVVIMSKIE